MNLITDAKFAEIMKQHMIEIIGYFFDNKKNFGVLCKIDKVEFDPPLPEHISAGFNELTLFFLAGYTFESAYIQDDYLVFEAGFGSENFGSLVTVPLLSIVHIVYNDIPVFINSVDIDKIDIQKKSAEVDEDELKSSMDVFLSNPENQNLFKK